MYAAVVHTSYDEIAIESSANGFLLKNNGDSAKTLQIEQLDDTVSNNVNVASYQTGETRFCWNFTKVTNVPTGIRLINTSTGYAVTEPTKYLPNGQSKSMANLGLKIVYYGNTTTYTGNPTSSSNTSVAQISSGQIKATGEGNARITIRHHVGSGYKYAYLNVVVTIAEGTYFFKNRETLKYMQPDNNGDSHMEHHDFNGNDVQIWQLIFDGSRYYRIRDKNSGLYLTVQDSTASGKSVKQEAYSSSNSRQLWEFTKLDIGSYKIKSKFHIDNNTNLVLAVGWGLNWNGTNIEQRAFNDENNKDEWLMEKTTVSYIARETQQKTQWCWVTSARMFAKNSYPAVTRTQREAVINVKGSAIDEAGTNDEIIEAINYYVGNIAGASIDSVSYTYRVYSEDMIKRFIDDGYVMAVGRLKYADINNANSSKNGHEVIIYGYIEFQYEDEGQIYSDCRYLVRDPWDFFTSDDKMMSYEKLYNGRNAWDDEDDDDFVWFDCVVINTSYDDDTVPYYFNN